MINYADLAFRLAGKHVKDDALMPAAYRKGARSKHDDFPFFPLTQIPRQWTTYRVPLPFAIVEAWNLGGGWIKPRWMPWQEGYPESPGMVFRPVEPGGAAWDLRERFGKPIEREVSAYDPVLPYGQAALFSAWIDNAWRPCFYTMTRNVFGKRLHHNRGAKPDMTHGDFHVSFPEASLTWT